MSDSESPLSTPPDSEDEVIPESLVKSYLVKPPSPPPAGRKQRKKEPPHVPTFADLPEIAFIVAFQSRFHAAFRGVPNLGCQDLETGVINMVPSEQVEQLLCRLLSLVLNRKKNVERGHHNRALEEAIQANQSQWPLHWEGRTPLAGGKKFDDLDAKQRLVLLRYLILWALSSSDTIRAIIAENYKTNRRNDDLNVALSVQPWGRDGEKRRYWLIEGRDDTPFRLYRESNPLLKNVNWISIAGAIDELKAVAADLEEHGNKHSTELAKKIHSAIPRFEEGENKRKRREYRASRKAYFSNQAAAYSYEGRTRGKRIKYTFSDDDERGSNTGTSEQDGVSTRRSGRTSRAPSIAPEAPRFTASGRQIKKPGAGPYGEMRINGTQGTSTGAATPASVGSENGDSFTGYGRGARRGGMRNTRYNMSVDESADEGDATSSRDEGEDYEDEGSETDEDEMSVDDLAVEEQDAIPRSFNLILKYNAGGPVANFLARDWDRKKQNNTEPLYTKPTSSRPTPQTDTMMVDSFTNINSQNEVSTEQANSNPVDSIRTKDLPVIEARLEAAAPSSVAEIRSKAPDVG